MNKRLLSLLIAVAFLFTAGTALAQFGIKKKKEEKPPEKKEESSSSSGAGSAEAMKDVNWADNAITFQVPANWQEMMLQRDIGSFMLMPANDSAGMTVTISRLGDNFPADASLKATRDDAAKKKQAGEVASYEDRTCGQVKGVLWLEAEKPNPDDVRRLTWTGFQKRKGWNQIIVHLSAKSSAFAKHEPTFRKVLDTLKVQNE